MGIPGYVFIIVGGIVGGVSYFESSLRFFMYIGGFFLVYGVAKSLIQFITRTKVRESEQNIVNNQLHWQKRLEQRNKSLGNQNQYFQQQPANVKYCHFCGSKVRADFRFCPGCGNKIM